MEDPIQFADFLKVDVRAGTIVSARLNEKARKPSYVLEIDFGQSIGLKQSSAQITDHYSAEDLIGEQVIAVVNFPPKNIAGIVSEVLVLAIVEDDGKAVLVSPGRKVTNGLRMF